MVLHTWFEIFLKTLICNFPEHYSLIILIMFDKQFDNFLNDKITDFSEIEK